MSTTFLHEMNTDIDLLRAQHPDGLHFVVGDIHGEWTTLKRLLELIRFDPDKDHVYFVGDYNAGGDVRTLLTYISNYYQADYTLPGFHLIRGNHERELWPVFPLENLPDIIVLRKEILTYYITHAGMITPVFNAINRDMAEDPDKTIHAYKFEDSTVCDRGPFRRVIWSRGGQFTQRTNGKVWPTEENLHQNHACIIHGHAPFCFFLKGKDYGTYGAHNLFWEKQHVFFSEDLQSFNIDSNAKGRIENGHSYRGLACVCLEVLEEAASKNGRRLTVDGLHETPNAVFSTELVPCPWDAYTEGNIQKILDATPEMKTIFADDDHRPLITKQ